MSKLLDKIVDNPLNKLVLKYIEIDFLTEHVHFKNWEKSRSVYDEGGIDCFEKFGIEIPKECNFSFDIHNLMINPNAGEIFAFHTADTMLR